MLKRNRISIIIPYFKKKKYFKETIKSILNQSYKSYEVIVIYDDTSLDELDFVKKTLRKIKLNKLIINSKNYGVGISRNIGIKQATGTLIAFCDADDTWKKNKLNTQINFMIKNNLMISHTNYFVINEKSKVIGKFNIKNKLSYNDLLKSCDIGLSTVIAKKKILITNKFNKLRTKEDYLLWLKIVKKIKFIYGLNQDLSCWRKGKNSLSSSVMQKLLDAYILYRLHLNNNFIVSTFFSFRLTFYAIRKKFFITWNIN
jgi:teichuronic acid biosynthesis glycosyltransferase TuaG